MYNNFFNYLYTYIKIKFILAFPILIYLIQILCDMGASICKEMKSQRNRLVYFYSSFDEEWTIVEEYDSLRSMRQL